MDGNYRIAMNRDEQRTRLPSTAVRETWSEQHPEWKFIYPVDPESGGTWIGTRSDGMTLALLNQTESSAFRPARTISRGTLIPEGLTAKNLREAISLIREMTLRAPDPVLPFLLVGIDGGKGPVLSIRWVGTEAGFVEREWPRTPLIFSSSSIAEAAVIAEREARFRKFQTLHPYPEKSAMVAFLHEVRLSRVDARTVSQSLVSVDASGPHFEYFPIPREGDVA